MSAKTTKKFDPPIEDLGTLKAAIDQFIAQHPNPTEEPRPVRLLCTVGGKIKSMTVTEAS